MISLLLGITNFKLNNMRLLVVLIFLGFSIVSKSQASIHVVDTTKKIMIVQASCGQCQFHMKGKGCTLAVKIDSVAYFVDGTNIDDHGNAHAGDGFCETVRKAEVQGTIVNNRFMATYFKLMPIKKD